MNLVSPRLPLLILLLSAILFSLTACGGSDTVDDINDSFDNIDDVDDIDDDLDDDDNGNDDAGPDYSGSESAATVDTENQADIATASRDSTVHLIGQSEGEDLPDLPSGVVLEEGEQTVTALTQSLIESAQLPTAATNTIDGSCGGSATIDTATDGSNSWIEYDNYCTGSTVIDGRIVYSVSDDLLVYEYQNVTVTHGDTTETINMEMRCDLSNGYDCTYSSNLDGSDGRTYRTTSSEVTGNSSSGYDVSARVYDPDHGYIDIQASGITVCDNGGIGSGTISVTDSSGDAVLTIEFSSCDSMTVTYNGNAQTYDQ